MDTMKAWTMPLAFALLLAAGAARAEEQTIAISDFAFSPQNLTVPVGTKVTWVNRDEEPHRVVENGGTFRSAALDTDGRYSFAFTQPGTYRYFCSIHPKMTGTVTVVAGR